MGSSKKHKEKHSRKERKRRRSRSRSRSRERTHDRAGRDDQNFNEDITSFIAKSRSEGEAPESSFDQQRALDERNRDRDYQNEVDRKWKSSRKERESYKMVTEISVKSEPDAPQRQPPTSGDISLSIEETNKLRLQLGLKPLDVGGSKDSEEKGYADRDDVHMPAKNIAAEKEAEKLKLKLEEIRQKRLLRKKLDKVKTIADDDDPVLESAAAWVAKARQDDKEKKLAQQRAKQLEEMDEEFGINSLATEMFSKSKADRKQSYSSRDLKGLKIEHDSGAFENEKAVILTLKDKGILEDENEDVLINVNINEDEKTAKNVENRKNLPGYRPFDEMEDDSSMFKARGILEKYDEELDGAKQKSFRLGQRGTADLQRNSELQKMKDDWKAQQVTLEGVKPKLALDFFTEEEMVTFNKPKKKRKVQRKRTIVKADDLVPLQDNQQSDLGSRSGKKSSKADAPLARTSYDAPAPSAMDMDIDDEFGSVEIHRPENDEPIAFEEDEAQLELQMALERSRRRTQKLSNNHEEIALAVKTSSLLSDSKQKQNKGLIVLDLTSEFCRALGEADSGPSSSSAGNQAAPESDHEDDVDMDIEPDADAAGGWEQVTADATVAQTPSGEVTEEQERVMDDEPVVTGSVGAALRLATMKGYLDTGKKKERNFAALNLPKAKIVIDEEKLRDEERGRYDRGGHDRDRDRDRYDPYAFKEKEDYKPSIKLEYIDQHGRDLTPKEAFRYLSHKFHGKGSGKMKTEKRNKKVLDDMRLQKMSSVDTPLNLVKMMSDKQEQTHTPYVVLSGGGKNLLTSTTKLKK